MTDLWFVLLTIILVKPVTDGGPERVGDILKSTLVGAAETEAKCWEAADHLRGILIEQGGGSVAVSADCILLPAIAGDAYDMTKPND